MNQAQANKEGTFSLTIEQQRAIFAGDHTALKLQPGDPKPEVSPGETIVLAMKRGGKQFLAKSHEDRLKLVEQGLPLLTEIPSEPTVWIVLKEPSLKEGRWVIEFEAHDVREPTRTLAAAPTGNRQPGLKTRQKKRVKKKDEYKDPSWTPETERGYGGGGKSTVDEREGVDDATLSRYSRLVAEENEMRRNQSKAVGHLIAEEMRLARKWRKPIPPRDDVVKAIKRRIERAQKRLRNAA